MDIFLGKVTQQAMNYAIRSGVALTATYAIKQSNKLLSSTPKSSERDELMTLQQRLQHKIRIISPAIDMIELIAARGNTTLESAVSLTKDLRIEIQQLGNRLASAASDAERAARSSRVSSTVRAQNELEMKLIVIEIKKLLERIEDAVPLINLAITTSGATLSTTLPKSVSPSRLLQASTFLTAGDTQYSLSPRQAVQIGPTFTLTIYMLFAGHDKPQSEEEVRQTTWKEVIHKARVKLRRVPLDIVVGTGSGSEAIPSKDISATERNSERRSEIELPAETRVDEFAYQIMIIEDFDDSRVHDFEADQPQPGPLDDVDLAGIREMIPVHEVSKIFYADTSRVLNIPTEGEVNRPVLLLRRDVNAIPPRRMAERDAVDPDDQNENDQKKPKDMNGQHTKEDHDDRQQDPWRLPPSLDPEWIAFEVYNESEDSDSDSEGSNTGVETNRSNNTNKTSRLSSSMSHLSLKSNTNQEPLKTQQPPPWVNAIKTSLSLLELLLRLTSLQQFQQQSHLSITDELLNFFLEENASTGAGGDEHYRQALRSDARRRVGWDPYDESPMKKRGEDYQYHHQQHYDSEEYQDYHQPQRLGYTPSQQGNSGSNRGTPVGTPAPYRGKSSSGEMSSPSPRHSNYSPSPMASTGRNSQIQMGKWSRQSQFQPQNDRRGSPLRTQQQQHGDDLTDEGIGTSPASGVLRSQGNRGQN